MNSVIIIGGGIAGLGAARALARRGVRVTVLEAKGRLGGRIRTVRHGKIPIELGAEFIHGRNRRLLNLIAEAGLPTHPIAGQYHLFANGRLEPSDSWDMAEDVIGKIDPHSPDVSFKTFVDSEALSDRARQMATAVVEGFDAADPARISAHSLLRARYSFDMIEGDRQGRVDAGYGALIDFLADDISRHGGEILTNRPVRRVNWRAGEVEVLTEEGRQVGSHRAEAAIVTIPLGAWKSGRMRFVPELPEKLEAAHDLEFGNVVKAILVFHKQWWPQSVKGFFQALEEPFPTWWTNPHGPVLTAWAGGPKADEILAGTVDWETLCLETLAKIFSERISVLRSRLAAFYTSNWADDPDVGGSYSYIPVNGMDLPKLLAAPVRETLFFAGEATVGDAITGTVFGALESGVRAAGEVMQRETARLVR